MRFDKHHRNSNIVKNFECFSPRWVTWTIPLFIVLWGAGWGCSRKKCKSDADCPEGTTCYEGKCISLKGSKSPAGPGAGPRRGKPDPNTVYKVEVNPKKHPILGPKDALVTIVEISEFQCPFCKRGAKTVKKLLKKYPKQVRLVFMHNPLAMHKQAFDAALAAQTVFALGGSKAFWKFHDILFANQKALHRADLEKYAGQVGVDVKKFKKAMDAKKHARTVKRQMALARKLGGRGVPAFFINGRSLTGARPQSAFVKLIDEELAKAKKLVKTQKLKPGQVYAHIMKDAESAVK
jgi:protein-disulfide isomerase